MTGVEQTCPELGLRPLLPRLDTPERALRHPVAAELTACGALDEAGNVDPMIREWLTVLLRRDLGLVLNIAVPGRIKPHQVTVALQDHPPISEPGDRCARRIPAGTARDEAAASELVVGQVERLCGVAEAAPLRPVTLDTQQLLESVRDAEGLKSFLLKQRLDVDQLHILTTAADPARSASASIVAVQAGVGPENTARFAIGESAVAIVDTTAGRLWVEGGRAGGRRYQVISPGSRSDIGAAIRRLIRDLPAGEEWYSYRRVV